jgi:hypothetical protein
MQCVVMLLGISFGAENVNDFPFQHTSIYDVYTCDCVRRLHDDNSWKCVQIGYVDGVKRLRTAATDGSIVHPPGDM